MRTFLKRLHYTFLTSHEHVKPMLGGEGWQIISANTFISFVDDLFIYGVTVALSNFKACTTVLWIASKEKMGE